MKRAVIVFTRVPIPGQTKTRMMPYFSPEECAKLHENFLKDIAQECEKVNADIFVCYTPEKGKAYLEKLFRKAKEYISQTGEGLGERMYQAIEYMKVHAEREYDGAIVKKLLESVAVYPVGMQVLTNENEVGEVIRQNKDVADRPVMKMVRHSDGSTYTEYVEKDLLKYLTVFIIDIL